jgi:maleamate amidohydrolase
MANSPSDLDDDYAKAGFGQKLDFGKKPALLMIDFVEAYFDPQSPLYADIDDALSSALRIREVARQKNIPVIYTNVVYHESMQDAGRFFEKSKPLEVWKQGSKWGDWPKRLKPAQNELVISKQYPSAFFGTSLSSTLTAQGIDCVILTGISTSGCVRATCVDACSHGFITFVVSDACGDRHPAPHEANLFDMNAKYAEVVSEDAVMDLLGTI